MFVYCTERLHLSEAEAYLRIAAARASREHPTILAMLADGRLHLTAIAKLAPHLTPENRDALLQRATHRTKREIEELVAELAPRSDVQATIRKLPERRTAPPHSRQVCRRQSCRTASPSSAAPEPTLQPGSDGGGLPTLELRPDPLPPRARPTGSVPRDRAPGPRPLPGPVHRQRASCATSSSGSRP